MNILVMICSASKNGNTAAIADKLIENLENKQLEVNKVFLYEQINKERELIESLEKADKIILSLPIYENSVPASVLRLFEMALANRENLSCKSKEMLVITNSGFPEVEANSCAINTCKLFAEKMELKWMGGFAVAPGELIGGKKLDEAGGSMKKVIQILDIISEKIYRNENIPEEIFNPMSKPLMSPFLYRLFGGFILKKEIKKVGKEKYYSKPLANCEG